MGLAQEFDGVKYGEALGLQLEKITGLQEILTSQDASYALMSAAHLAHMLEILVVAKKYHLAREGKCVELFDEFPRELAQECQWPISKDLPVAGSRSKDIGNVDWVDKRTRPVFCWRRADIPAYY